MTKPRKTSVRNDTPGLSDRQAADFRHQEHVHASELVSFEALISAAILAATAFRLKDQDALTQALRRLVQAVRPFETES
jgi:hypothetical protein